MQRLGKVVHLSKSGRLILRSKTKARTGLIAMDEGLKSVGTVFDTFGPVENPYISVKPSVHDPGRYVGQILYVDEETEPRRKRNEY